MPAPFLVRSLGAFSRRLPYYRGKWRIGDKLLQSWLAQTNWTDIVTLRGGLRVGCNLFDEVGSNIWWLGDQYEFGNLILLRSILKPGGVFLDVGANIGLYTLLAARMVGPEGKVVAFEPLAATFALLSRNVHDLNQHANTQCVQAALSNVTGTGVIHVGPRDNSGASSLEYDWGKTGQSENVTLLRLDDCPALAPLTSRVSVMKIDTQGHELKVLEGARRIIESARPSVMIEVDEAMFRDAGASREALYGYFAGLGYRPYRILKSGRTEPIQKPQSGSLILFAHPSRWP